MKIDTYLNSILEKYVKQSKTQKREEINIKEKTNSQDQISPNNNVDKIEISQQAKILSELSLEEDSKAQRINEIKAQLEKGTYKPPIDEIAKSILKEWKGE